LAFLPRRSHARSLITIVERVDALAAGDVRDTINGVPVKAVAVAMAKANRRAVILDNMNILFSSMYVVMVGVRQPYFIVVPTIEFSLL